MVKGYSQHEYQTLVNVIKQRGGNNSDAAINFKAVAEQYPNLKADAQYQQLMNELTDLEDEIADTRLACNKATRKYNDRVLSFPMNLIAKMFHFKEEIYYKADGENLDEITHVKF